VKARADLRQIIFDALDLSDELRNECTDAVVAAISALDRTTLPAAEGWKPTHQHVKRGSKYRLDGYGEIQTDAPIGDYCKVAIYRAEDGTTWVRPVSEFEDGRFTDLSKGAL